MNAHNAKTELVVGNEVVRIVAGRDDVRLIRSNFMGVAALSISDDDDKGNDPYNNTGQHVIIKSKFDLQD
ncbi:MAG: hypothetical protein HQ492_01525 [Woeseiaceae bacterium]|nr:hypothetical protein [Woeseiaceae bacterium]